MTDPLIKPFHKQDTAKKKATANGSHTGKIEQQSRSASLPPISTAKQKADTSKLWSAQYR